MYNESCLFKGGTSNANIEANIPYSGNKYLIGDYNSSYKWDKM